MRRLYSLLVILGVLSLAGCVTVVERKAGYYVTKGPVHYRVYGADGSLALVVSKRAGPYKKNPYTSDACFINHDFSPTVSYGVRLGFSLAPKTGTGIRLLTDVDKGEMKCSDGAPKFFDSQYLASANGWDLLYYAAHTFYEFDGKQVRLDGQSMLAMKRVGRYVAYVEQYVYYDTSSASKAEAEMISILQDYRIIKIRPTAPPTGCPKSFPYARSISN